MFNTQSSPRAPVSGTPQNRTGATGGTRTLFEKYGGFTAVRGVVMEFYERALDSDLVGPFFEHIDMRRLVDHQTKFVSFLLGGPADCADDRLRKAHAHLGVTHEHFDEVKRLLNGVLSEAGFDAVDCEAVLAAIERRRSLVVA